MIFIRYAELHMSIRGFVMPDSDGNYNIYINDKLSEECKAKTIKHELEHIKNNDCYLCDKVCEIEENCKKRCSYG